MRDYFRETWTTSDGLPHNLVSSIVQTGDGYLWFGTWEGVARYNGHRFDLFDERSIAGLQERGVLALAVDREGELMVGLARSGLLRHRAGRWSSVPLALKRGSPGVLDIVEIDGRTVVGTLGNGVWWVDEAAAPERLVGTEPLASNTVYAVARSIDGSVWLGTDNGLFRWQAGTLEPFGERHRLPKASVLALSADRQGRVLVGTERGAFLIDRAAVSRVFEGAGESSVEAVLIDRHGALWAGGSLLGLYRQSALGVESLDIDHGLPSTRVASLAEDREGSVWVGTSQGLLRLRQAPFFTLTADKGLNGNYVRTLLESDDGDLYIGSSEGVTRVRGDGSATSQIEPLDLRESVISMLAGAPGQLWLGTYYRGVIEWRDGQVVQRFDRQQGLPGNQVRSLLRHQDGSIYVGTNRGLARLQAGAVERLDLRQLPAQDIITMFQQGDGTVWLGTSLGAAHDRDGEFIPLRDPALSKTQRVYGFAEEPDGTLWLVGDRGLARRRDGQWSALGAESGLPVAGVFGILVGPQGNYWLSSNRGVVRIERRDMEAAFRGVPLERFEVFSEADGMASAQCNGAAGVPLIKRSDGALWFATSAGAARVIPASLARFPRLLPAVVIERLRVDGDELPISREFAISSAHRRIELQFAGLSFQAPGKTRYRYRLEGLDDDWVISGSERSAQFTTLAPGEYRFRASAANPNGDWSPHEAELRIRVTPQWWQQSWFLIGVLALALLLAWGLLRLRLNVLQASERRLRAQVDSATIDLQRQADQLREQNIELDAYAHTVAHDLKTPLTTVQGFAQLLAQSEQPLSAEQQQLAAERVLSTARKMADIINALLLLSRVRTDEAVDIGLVDNRPLVRDALQRLQPLIEQHQAELVIPAELPVVMGYPPWVEEVWVNYLSNAIKYGGGEQRRSRVEVGGEVLRDGRVRLWVQDNGPGLDAAARTRLYRPFSRISEIGGDGHGLGLSIVRRIVERMGGEVGCSSEPGAGARFWFVLPASSGLS
nr:two-component regulator propeller domain-containing protein [Pseudomarimonas arenosa]